MRGPRTMVARSLLLAAALMVSGCIGGGPKAALTASEAPDAAPSESTGSITGMVVDEEQRPVAGVAVAFTGAVTKVLTDAAGAFTINDVAPGDYTVFFERLGYESAARAAQVRAGETTDLKVVIVAIDVGAEPYHAALKKVAHIHVDNIYLSDCLSNCGAYLNNSQLNSLRCDPCQFVLHLEPKPSAAFTEATWPPSSAPYVNTDMCYYYYRDWSETSTGTFVSHWCLNDREGYAWPDAELGGLKAESAVKLYVFGATIGVSYEHKIDLWTTFGYNGDLPEDYSALPPS